MGSGVLYVLHLYTYCIAGELELSFMVEILVFLIHGSTSCIGPPSQPVIFGRGLRLEQQLRPYSQRAFCLC